MAIIGSARRGSRNDVIDSFVFLLATGEPEANRLNQQPENPGLPRNMNNRCTYRTTPSSGELAVA